MRWRVAFSGESAEALELGPGVARDRVAICREETVEHSTSLKGISCISLFDSGFNATPFWKLDTDPAAYHHF